MKLLNEDIIKNRFVAKLKAISRLLITGKYIVIMSSFSSFIINCFNYKFIYQQLLVLVSQFLILNSKFLQEFFPKRYKIHRHFYKSYFPVTDCFIIVSCRLKQFFKVRLTQILIPQTFLRLMFAFFSRIELPPFFEILVEILFCIFF